MNEVFGKFRIQTCALMAFPNPRGWQDDRKESETLFTRFPWHPRYRNPSHLAGSETNWPAIKVGLADGSATIYRK